MKATKWCFLKALSWEVVVKTRDIINASHCLIEKSKFPEGKENLIFLLGTDFEMKMFVMSKRKEKMNEKVKQKNLKNVWNVLRLPCPTVIALIVPWCYFFGVKHVIGVETWNYQRLSREYNKEKSYQLPSDKIKLWRTLWCTLADNYEIFFRLFLIFLLELVNYVLPFKMNWND